MKDSILKGTGNSRFLKSAIPDGTTWAEALAMLRAGTFPMDLNGINNAGFQQVGTPLNKANLLKDVNALTLGLTGDAVPDDMFNVLAHAGDLHVWKKTVVTKEPVPAGYTLDTQKTTQIYTATRDVAIPVSTASSVKINDSGGVELVNPNENRSSGTFSDYINLLRGNFVQFSVPYTDSNRTTLYATGTYFVPQNANVTGSLQSMSAVMQEVKSYPLTPARTTVTYPVSTNRNAYQEGNDAKPAGYTLGATQKNVQILSGGDNWHTTLYYADSVVVDDEGKLSLQSPNSYTFVTSSQYQNVSTFAIGRFIKIVPESGSGFSFMDGIWFVPSDSTITVENFKLYASKIQPVTGYAATPAGTTIEYLGCLGDKARVQVVSYVGTGTYGGSNPNSLTFDFVPKMVIIRQENDAYAKFDWIIGITSVEVHWDGSYNCFVAIDGKKLSFYSLSNPLYQMNENGQKYYAIAIG